MRLALAGTDALRVTRALRSAGLNLHDLPHADLCDPDPSPRRRFRPDQLNLELLCLQNPPTEGHRLNIAVPSQAAALRSRCVTNTIMAPSAIPPESFLEVGDGVQIPCPELLFIQMGSQMQPAIQLALGMELCGSYSRDACYPTDGRAIFGLAPATSQLRISVFLEQCHRIRGIQASRQIVSYVCDNAWSPMEGSSASLLSLPFGCMGYGLAPVVLNKREIGMVDLPGMKRDRVPDILFAGTHVGFNYDSELHLELGSIVRAATQSALEPQSLLLANALDTTVKSVRNKYLDDRRRDRELWAQGLEVMPITLEDLAEKGGFDRLAAWAMQRIESEGARDLSEQWSALRSGELSEARQQLVWSMLPGKRGHAARTKLAARK